MNPRKKSGELQSMQIGDSDPLTPRPRAPLINRYPPPKTTICGLILCVGGLFFLCFGISVFFTHIMSHARDRGIAMMVLGGLMFLPGSYAITIIIGTWYGWRGYDYSQLPSYDD